MCNMVTQVTYLNLSYKFLHKLHLQEMPSQDFIGCLKESKFGAAFKWDENLSHRTLHCLAWLDLDSKHAVFVFHISTQR